MQAWPGLTTCNNIVLTCASTRSKNSTPLHVTESFVSENLMALKLTLLHQTLVLCEQAKWFGKNNYVLGQERMGKKHLVVTR